MNNKRKIEGSESEDEELDDEIEFPTAKKFKAEAQTIVDFSQSWVLDLELAIVMVLRRVSRTRAIYIQQYQPKVSKRYLENFHLYMGKQFSKPPPPQPKKWLDQCMKTAIPNIGWKPTDWFDKIKLEQNPQKGWLTIDKCMPPFMWVVRFNTNFLEKKNSQHFFHKQ